MRLFTLLALFVSSACVATPSETFSFIEEESTKDVYALLISSHEAELSSELNATIKTIPFKPGMHFTKGQTLISFDCMPVLLELKQIEATLKATKATLQSNQNLAKHNAISKLDLQLSESEHEKMLAKKLLLLHQKKKCTIKAPFDGAVISLEANEHESVQTNTPLLSIANNHSFEVQMFVPSHWFKHIKKGTPFHFFVDELQTHAYFEGHITKILTKIDAASQSLLVFGTLTSTKNHHALTSGMSGHARFLFDEAK